MNCQLPQSRHISATYLSSVASVCSCLNGPAGFCVFAGAGSSAWNTFPIGCSLPLTSVLSTLIGSLNPTSSPSLSWAHGIYHLRPWALCCCHTYPLTVTYMLITSTGAVSRASLCIPGPDTHLAEEDVKSWNGFAEGEHHCSPSTPGSS